MPGILPKWQEVLRDHDNHRRHVGEEMTRLQREGVPYGEACQRAEAKFAAEAVPTADLYDAIAMQRRAELDAAREAGDLARLAAGGDNA